jgi:4-hydroxy-3-methylbut-2-en-1-yl diphosphate synthase IspG/GcpE
MERRKESRRKESRRKESRRKVSRRKVSRRKVSRRIRKGGSQYKKVKVKSLPNKKNEKLEEVLKECDISVIKFYMPECPHCVDIKGTWEELGKSTDLEEHCKKENCTMSIIEVNVNDYKEDINKDYIGESQGVPHIICVKDKKVIDTFNEERNINNFIEFAKSAINKILVGM